MADGSGHSLFVVEETVPGTTPTNPALIQVRNTGTTLALNKDSLQSEEIRDDRQISDFRLGANQVAGDIPFELSYGSFDLLLEGALLSDPWAPIADTTVISIDSALGTFTRSTGDFLADGFLAGQTIISSGYVDSNNNGRFTIDSLTDLVLTVSPADGQTQTTEAGGGDEQILTANQIIKAGKTRKSLSFIRYFSDVLPADKPYHIFTGNELNQLQLTIAANTMVTGSFSVVGRGQTLANDLTGLGTPTYPAVSTTKPLDSFTGVLKEGGTTIAVITEVSLTLQNGIEPKFVVGSKDSIAPSIGRSNLTGQITAFFEDSTLLEKFINETESDIEFTLPDAAGNQQTYRIPRVIYTGGQPDVSGEGPVTLAMPFQAVLDATQATNIVIERLSAA